MVFRQFGSVGCLHPHHLCINMNPPKYLTYRLYSKNVGLNFSKPLPKQLKGNPSGGVTVIVKIIKLCFLGPKCNVYKPLLTNPCSWLGQRHTIQLLPKVSKQPD